MLPIGNVHPNTLGYQVIADDMAAATPSAVPEPATWMLLASALSLLGPVIGRRRAGVVRWPSELPNLDG